MSNPLLVKTPSTAGTPLTGQKIIWPSVQDVDAAHDALEAFYAFIGKGRVNAKSEAYGVNRWIVEPEQKGSEFEKLHSALHQAVQRIAYTPNGLVLDAGRKLFEQHTGMRIYADVTHLSVPGCCIDSGLRIFIAKAWFYVDYPKH